MNLKLFLILALMSSNFAWPQSYFVGTGMSKVTQGRLIPLLQVGVDNQMLQFQFTSLGISNELYYHSNYKASVLIKKNWANTPMLSGVASGYGLGLMHSKRGYREDTDEDLKEREDTLLGSVFRIEWNIASRFYISLDSFYASKGFLPIALSFQNENTVAFGMRF